MRNVRPILPFLVAGGGACGVELAGWRAKILARKGGSRRGMLESVWNEILLGYSVLKECGTAQI